MKTYFSKTIMLFLLLIALTGMLPAQSGNSEIFVFKVEKNGEKTSFSGGTNITASPGYDNQPSFAKDGKSLLFTADRNVGNTNIYEYVFATKKTNQITTSKDNEYTSRAIGNKFITFIREGAGQEMTIWKYDRTTKIESRALINKQPVAYYDWNTKGDAVVWVRYASTALFIDSKTKRTHFIADHVIPSAPQNIPGTTKFSFVHRQGNDTVWIKEFDTETRAVRPIVQTKDGKIDYCWMPDGTILMGSGASLFGFKEGRDKENWVLMADLSKFGLKDITRLSAAQTGDRIAVVSNQ